MNYLTSEIQSSSYQFGVKTYRVYIYIYKDLIKSLFFIHIIKVYKIAKNVPKLSKCSQRIQFTIKRLSNYVLAEHIHTYICIYNIYSYICHIYLHIYI